MTDGREQFACAPYAERRTTFDGVIEVGAWRLKRYTIVDGDAFDAEAFADATAFCRYALPSPARDALRPGVGVLIRHEGRTMRYLVLCWWDNENELPMRVWVQPTGGDACWRRAAVRESVCVWDMLALTQEREAYVRHVLGRDGGPDLAAYLEADGAARER